MFSLALQTASHTFDATDRSRASRAASGHDAKGPDAKGWEARP